jgi:hypothetical protein
MNTSILIARILAIIYLAVSVGILINWKYYQKAFQEVMQNSGFVLISGFIASALGMAIISYHNVWSDDWTSSITIIGWIALLKGIWLLVSPRELSRYTMFVEAKFSRWVLLTVTLGLGLVFGWFGFMG